MQSQYYIDWSALLVPLHVYVLTRQKQLLKLPSFDVVQGK